MVKRIAQAWAFAAILLLPDYIDLTSGEGDARMRVPGPLTRIALAHLTDMLIVAILFLVLTAWLRALSSWPRISWALMALLPPLLLARNRELIPFDFPWAAVLVLAGMWVVLLAYPHRESTRHFHEAEQSGRRRSNRLCGLCHGDVLATWSRGALAAGSADHSHRRSRRRTRRVRAWFGSSLTN